MKNLIDCSFICLLILCWGNVAASQALSPLGSKQEFNLGSVSGPMMSPSATSVAQIRYDIPAEKRYIDGFILDESAGKWSRLPPLDVSGTACCYPYQWGVDENGEEFLVFPKWKKAIAYSDGEVEVVGIPVLEYPSGILEPETGRIGDALYRWENREKRRAFTEETLGRISPTLSPEKRVNMETEFNQIRPQDIRDISPDGNTVLFYEGWSTNHTDSVIARNMNTGERVEYTLHERNSFVDYTNARFSPDGNYVLVSFNYGPDHDHAEVPGYLQLFRRDGHFVEELTVYDSELGWNSGHYKWLHNNWIVYTTPSKLVFQKFVGGK